MITWAQYFGREFDTYFDLKETGIDTNLELSQSVHRDRIDTFLIPITECPSIKESSGCPRDLIYGLDGRALDGRAPDGVASFGTRCNDAPGRPGLSLQFPQLARISRVFPLPCA